MCNYAQIDSNNICFAITQTDGEIIGSDVIKIDSYDTSLLGQRYNTGTWEPVEAPEPQPEPLTETEQAILDTAVNIEYLVTMSELKI